MFSSFEHFIHSFIDFMWLNQCVESWFNSIWAIWFNKILYLHLFVLINIGFGSMNWRIEKKTSCQVQSWFCRYHQKIIFVHVFFKFLFSQIAEKCRSHFPNIFSTTNQVFFSFFYNFAWHSFTPFTRKWIKNDYTIKLN